MNRRLIIVIGVLLLCFLGWWFYSSGKPVKQAQGMEKEALKKEGVTNQIGPSKKAQPLTEDQRTESINKWETHRESLIEFWGKAVDQHDQPIEGVKIKCSILSHKIALPGTPLRDPYYYGTTDSGGNFHIKTDYGRAFTIESIEKEGYVLSPDLRGRSENLYIYNYDNAKFDRFQPDPSKPVIFKLWKVNGAEPMVECQRKEYRVPTNGQITVFDLLRGKMNAGSGDIRVAIWQDKPATGETRKGDWGYKIEAVEGGLIESTDRFMYLAPESGYQPKLEATLRASSTNWVEGVEKKLYLKSRGGQNFGRLTIKVWCDYDRPDTAVRIESYLNPNSSRNLEFDSAKRISQRFIEQYGLEKAIAISKGEAQP